MYSYNRNKNKQNNLKKTETITGIVFSNNQNN